MNNPETVQKRKTFVEEMEDLVDECAAAFESDDW
jgi:hypothetical protein